jgi:hypothetical protein
VELAIVNGIVLIHRILLLIHQSVIALNGLANDILDMVRAGGFREIFVVFLNSPYFWWKTYGERDKILNVLGDDIGLNDAIGVKLKCIRTKLSELEPA